MFATAVQERQVTLAELCAKVAAVRRNEGSHLQPKRGAQRATPMHALQ